MQFFFMYGRFQHKVEVTGQYEECQLGCQDAQQKEVVCIEFCCAWST